MDDKAINKKVGGCAMKLRKFIIYLIRIRLGMSKYEKFQFVNQKSDAVYYFTECNLMRKEHGISRLANVSLNWMLDSDCSVRPMSQDLFYREICDGNSTI